MLQPKLESGLSHCASFPDLKKSGCTFKLGKLINTW